MLSQYSFDTPNGSIMRAKWEYDATQNAAEQKTRVAIAALGNEALEDENRRKQVEGLGEFAYKIWDKLYP